MDGQRILGVGDNYRELSEYFSRMNFRKILLVCDSSIGFLNIGKYFDTLNQETEIEVIRFSSFCPNPLYESVVDGVNLFNQENCDAIVAVGGGSAIDVAKCIKLYATLDQSVNFLKQEIVPNDIPLISVPTTAGTGSEATRFAVIYYNGEKQSVADYSCIPSVVVFDDTALQTLPLYQKKATMMDAFCHAIESFWSVNSTEESKRYSSKAIEIILEYKERYLAGDADANRYMFEASNFAGKAINITQTTAGHAMCYKLTSLYNIAHGHAAALCVAQLWPFMLNNIDKCIDVRGTTYLQKTFEEMAVSMKCNTPMEAAVLFGNIVDELNFDTVVVSSDDDYEVLNNSVNPVRLKNNPVLLDSSAIDYLYHRIVGREEI